MKALSITAAAALFSSALVLALFAFFCVFNTGVHSLYEFPLDDAWIHQVYVRGLITDLMPTYNAGIPEAGFSSPLWLLVCMPGYLISSLSGSGPVVTAKINSMILAAIAAAGAGRLAGFFTRDTYAGIAAAAALLLSPGFAFSTVSGMEVTLAASCLAWAFVAWLHGRRISAGVLFALSALARPEAAVIIPVVILFELFPASRPLRDRARGAVFILLPAAVFASAWIVYNLSVAGRSLPNTFYVKATAPAGSNAIEYFISRVVLGYGILPAAGAIAAGLAGAFFALRNREKRTPALAVAAAGAAAVAGVMFTRRFEISVSYFMARYYYPFLVFWAVFTGLGLQITKKYLSEKTGMRPWTAALLPLVLFIGVSVPGLIRARDSYAAHCSDIYALHTRVALDALEKVPPDAVVGAEGAGSIRYHMPNFVLDLVGLNASVLSDVHGDIALRSCIQAGYRPSLLIIPDNWVSAFKPVFELEPVQVYEVRNWSVVDGKGPRRVQMLKSAVRPGFYEACRQRFGPGSKSR